MILRTWGGFVIDRSDRSEHAGRVHQEEYRRLEDNRLPRARSLRLPIIAFQDLRRELQQHDKSGKSKTKPTMLPLGHFRTSAQALRADSFSLCR